MYLNQFDFLYNAVGIENAAKVYFNKKPKDLAKEEAAMLIGMCKNPSLYNPYTYKIKNYRRSIAAKKGVAPEQVSREEVMEARAKDSSLAIQRRNQVLYQWLKNSKSENETTEEEIDESKNCPTDPAKWAASKAKAKSKFDVYPSAYANGFAAKDYKAKGGGWRK